MSLDITPIVNDDRLMISSYGDGRFTVNGKTVTGSILLYENKVEPWEITKAKDITLESIQPLLDVADEYDILVIGIGELSKMPPKDLREAVKGKGLVLEWMNSGAAARTFTVLQTEDRRTLAAIIAV
ncbi:Mth938-like domain-containing protein [Terasakiella sp. A23]|uniref:Mth938-like domain-containing protein n=1 Tax=Terasakiella sp. FCG-A23 TaxID=3080561 RepID=UPI002954E0D1|nr:Mth938-like domain-containing protein [Terasakiella sp. A23]MDV7338779.1 Mth938-like domain-containing protein [Terasakiella sp. A23]